jgi:hypothetical protein
VYVTVRVNPEASLFARFLLNISSKNYTLSEYIISEHVKIGDRFASSTQFMQR